MHKKMRDSPAQYISDVMLILGAAAVTAGIAMIYLPAGIISAGAGLIALGILVARGGHNAAD